MTSVPLKNDFLFTLRHCAQATHGEGSWISHQLNRSFREALDHGVEGLESFVRVGKRVERWVRDGTSDTSVDRKKVKVWRPAREGRWNVREGTWRKQTVIGMSEDSGGLESRGESTWVCPSEVPGDGGDPPCSTGRRDV